jgi:hypothetical protein
MMYEESKKRRYFSQASKKYNIRTTPLKFSEHSFKNSLADQKKKVDRNLKILDYKYSDSKHIIKEAEQLYRRQDVSQLLDMDALIDDWNTVAKEINHEHLEDITNLQKVKEISKLNNNRNICVDFEQKMKIVNQIRRAEQHGKSESLALRFINEGQNHSSMFINKK